MALNKSHGGQAAVSEFAPIRGENGENVGTTSAPKGEVMYGVMPQGQPGNPRRLH